MENVPIFLEVVAGALFDADGRVLIAERPPGKALAGRWEFPGGKLHEGEDAQVGLARELREELGVEVHAAERLIRYSHAYPERIVRLDLWIVASWSGEPRGLDGQSLKWVSPEHLEFEDILEADWPMIDALVARSEAGIKPRGIST
jgi:8-oxo-dGTP diphosphatase